MQPLLVLHGDADARVSIIESQQLVDKLQAAGSSVKFNIYPGEGHGLLNVRTQVRDDLHNWIQIHSEK
jgi:dipeptidyl aminopeptidase/acylaminoacyl peptidase